MPHEFDQTAVAYRARHRIPFNAGRVGSLRGSY